MMSKGVGRFHALIIAMLISRLTLGVTAPLLGILSKWLIVGRYKVAVRCDIDFLSYFTNLSYGSSLFQSWQHSKFYFWKCRTYLILFHPLSAANPYTPFYIWKNRNSHRRHNYADFAYARTYLSISCWNIFFYIILEWSASLSSVIWWNWILSSSSFLHYTTLH